ncbi:hypothetical protein ASPBRDRAFT_301709 [Aspergillus brasiliensis CBS 101740]|uniref:Uncharacterized protein n=1 Tax=Aspergillus brasiliensis (strain CBS 101740 / IMI 381727 / IBT 21946) TaxID=767769 RepID=A0A1L9U9Z2_ASPBC|nr:hypothetical protein ASPBRDRAFT_301709 [Aspergillus brasiliensis CBS 101740]
MSGFSCAMALCQVSSIHRSERKRSLSLHINAPARLPISYKPIVSVTSARTVGLLRPCRCRSCLYLLRAVDQIV